MNSKKVNWLFLSIILCHFAVVLILLIFGRYFNFTIAANLICSELILLVPALGFLIFTDGSLKEKLGLHRLKLSTMLMVVLFTFLTMPLTTMVNIISQLFVDNTALELSREAMDLPFFAMFFLMAVYGPVCEELVFRGVIFRGYRKNGGALGAVLLSGILFGLMHMNFNQAAYAVVIGILLSVLVESSGSIWSSIIYHVIFNGQTVVLVFLAQRLFPGILEQSGQAPPDTDMMLEAIGVYLVLAAVMTALAFGVLVWIAGNEGRGDRLREIWRGRKKKHERMITVPLILGVALCAGYMCLSEILM